MNRWYLNWKASRLVGRQDFASARLIYSRLVTLDRTDSFALLMLAVCYEHEDRVADASRAAAEAVRSDPTSLSALQMAARLAIAIEDHDRAATYVASALALPEVRTEIPTDIRVLSAVAWVMRMLSRLPILRHRVRAEVLADALRQLDGGQRALELQAWKHWAQEYVAWHAGSASPQGGSVVH